MKFCTGRCQNPKINFFLDLLRLLFSWLFLPFCLPLSSLPSSPEPPPRCWPAPRCPSPRRQSILVRRRRRRHVLLHLRCQSDSLASRPRTLPRRRRHYRRRQTPRSRWRTGASGSCRRRTWPRRPLAEVPTAAAVEDARVQPPWRTYCWRSGRCTSP